MFIHTPQEFEMTHQSLVKFVPLACFAAAAFASNAQAVTQTVAFNVLNATATLPTPFAVGDNLVMNTLVSQATGALSQTVTFSVASGVSGFVGDAVWQISTAGGTGPRLTGVNIDIFNSVNALVVSDTSLGTLGGFAVSSFTSAITPGTYRLVATGNGIRDSVLDVSMSFVPEPGTYLLLLAGIGVIAFMARRRAG